ncbi:fatty acyl-AMP ligase [Streptomyces coeruleorubidus]|uniref:fatty acyl-AMP ligase n=1 Tax=Streptomyces coeruleorubidus TaxID=116188 RepID=UPI00237F7977|nr:fatty acyl-AMP ligase [Streptomyces coeruleorubidus]WDV51801.1 fatty acyl-AMP ligase [Streptomyces coeruleorubidus]
MLEPSASPPDGLSLPEILTARAEAHPDALAFRFLPDGTTDHPVDWTYRDVELRSRAVARELSRRGIEDSRVVLALDPGLDYVAALFGILRAGCTAVPSFPPFGRRAMARFLSIMVDCEPRAVLTDGRFAPQVEAFEAQYPKGTPKAQWIFPDETLFEGDGAEVPPRLANPALLQYSSGSTGEPKGIVLTHENLVSNCRVLEAHAGMEPDRVGCSWLPPYHDMGLMGTIMLAVHGGWPLVMMSPVHFVQDPYRWLAALTEYRVTITVGPNFAFDLCTSSIPDEALDSLDLSSLRQVFCGSEPVSAATLERFRERFASCGYDAASLIPCYGLAEATLFVTGKPAKNGAVRLERLDKAALGTGTAVRVDAGDTSGVEVVGCGVSAVGHEVLVVDPQTAEVLPDGRVGEVWVAGPNVAGGYWRRPELSAAAFGARPAGAAQAGPGFLRTGDLGFVLDGELFVTGRLKDVIVISGRNLYPQDIEASVERCDGALRRCAVFSVSGDEAGGSDEEQVVVVAEYRGTSGQFAAQEKSLRAAVTAAVTADHGVRPAELYFGPPGTVLMTTSGKVRRKATKAAFLEGTLKRFTVPAGSGAAR